MDIRQHDGQRRSQLFLVRLWEEDVDSRSEWNGRAQDILSGQAYSFHDWAGLIDVLLLMLPPLDAGLPPGDGGDEVQQIAR